VDAVQDKLVVSRSFLKLLNWFTVVLANQLTGSRLVEHIPDGQYKGFYYSINSVVTISLALTGVLIPG
jgi:hypothetical protein